MLRSSTEVTETYPGKTFSKKCDNVLLGASSQIQKTAYKSANMQG
jgi:hypothetical protein